jgi:hypothetical protein
MKPEPRIVGSHPARSTELEVILPAEAEEPAPLELRPVKRLPKREFAFHKKLVTPKKLRMQTQLRDHGQQDNGR